MSIVARQKLKPEKRTVNNCCSFSSFFVPIPKMWGRKGRKMKEGKEAREGRMGADFSGMCVYLAQLM
jgi:hypothetical protein